jgi:cation transport ATPase
VPGCLIDSERSERLCYFGFAGFVGFLLLLNLTGYFKTVFGIDTAAIVTVLAGYRICFNSIEALLDREVSADLAICISVIAALAVGQYLAAAKPCSSCGGGKAGGVRGRPDLSGHPSLCMPRRRRVLRNGEELEQDAASLEAGDVIVVRAGERIPADGVVLTGTSSVDESTITGEALPREKGDGDEIYSGTLNGNGLLHIRVTRGGSETTLSRVVALVEEAREQRAPVEWLADRYARYFLPDLLLAAALTLYFTRDWLRTVAVPVP